MPIYKFIRQSFIAIMLLSFSVSVLSSQIGNISFVADTSINAIDAINEPVNSNDLDNDHCEGSPNTEHCNNCSHCTALSLVTTKGIVTKCHYDNRYSLFVPEISIDILIKPPRL